MQKYIGVRVYLLVSLVFVMSGCGDESPVVECRSTTDCVAIYTELGPCDYVRCDIPTTTCQVDSHQDYHQCEDGHPCTLNDYCLSGECLAGSEPTCDDGIDCTEDTCHEDSGCSHTPYDRLCDDQDDCTEDFCDALHGCSHAVDQTIPGCQVCSLDQDCDDQDQCTEDYCNLELLLCAATQLPDGSECDDEDPCTDPDTCQAGECLAGADVCSVEICDNLEDDDGDELVDCEDDDCLLDPACEPCDDDGMEDNDSIQTAQPVSPGHFFQLAACPEDPDYYQLELNAGDTLEVNIDFGHGEGDLDLRILDAAGDMLAESAGVEDGEFLQLVAEDSGIHFIEVGLTQDLGETPGNDYDLSVAVEGSTPTCPDDGFENNDSFNSAVPVAAGEFADLRSCPGDQDHYAFSAAAGDLINLAVMFSNLEGDIDLQLLDPQGQVVATASTTSDNETLAHTATLAGSHVARVWLDTDAGSYPGNVYALHIVVEQGTPSCHDDGFEDNDDSGQATSLAAGTYLGLQACPGDGDYFGVSLGVGDQISLDLTFAHAEGDIQLQLLDPGGGMVAESTSSTNDEALAYTAQASGRYLVVAWLADGSGSDDGNSYDMSIAVEQAVPTCDDDGFEDNDGPSQAVGLSEGAFGGLRSCPGDEDFFAVNLGVGDQITVFLQFQHAEGDIDLQLFRPGGGVVASSTTSNDDESLTYVAEQAGGHQVRVWLGSDSGSLEGNDYSVTITIEDAVPTCPDDGLEDNDSPGSAVMLNEGAFPGLRVCGGDEDFYAIVLGVGDQISVDLGFSDDQGDIDLQLLDPSGLVAASSTTSSDDESLVLTASKAGQHVIRVWLYLDAGVAEGNDYDLTIDVEDVVPTCPEDGFEDNDDFATAAGIGPGDFTALRACEGDDDFFAVILGVDHIISVDVLFSHDEGDIDLQLLDPSGTIVASSLSLSDDEAVVYTAQAAGVYRVRAWLHSDLGSALGNDYQMSVAVEEPVPTCNEDGFEDNDSPENAVGVNEGAYAGLQSCTGDEDYYAVNLGVDDEISVTVTFQDAEGDIDLQLLNPDGSVVASSTSTSDNESLAHTASSAGAYLVRTWLHADDGAVLGNDYDMVIDVQEAVPVCPEDDLEDNDTFATAASIVEGDYPDRRACEGDEDFYAVALGVGDLINVDLAFLDPEGDIDLQLLDSSGTVVASSSTSTDDESLNHTAVAAGLYRIRAWLYSDGGSQPGNDYDLLVVVEEAIPVCLEDSYEDNDSLLTAAVLIEGNYDALRSCNGDEDYYAVALGVDDEIRVSLLFTDDQGDIDLQLLDPLGLVVASSSTSSDNEDLTYTALAAGTYTVRAWLYLDAGADLGNDYDMVITVDEAVVTCPDDGFEDNDSFFTAALVLPDVYPGLRACDQDEDFYLITLFGGEQLNVDLAFQHAEGDIDLQLLDVLGDVVASSMTTSDDESLSYTAVMAGLYAVRVVLFDDAGASVGNDYDMSLLIQ